MEGSGTDRTYGLLGTGNNEEAPREESRAPEEGDGPPTIINRQLRRELRPKLLTPKSRNSEARIPNSGDARGLSPLTWAQIREGARTAMRGLFEKASADPSSGAYGMLEIMCLNELVEVQLKTREMDALEVFRARNQGRQLEMKAERLQSQNQLAEAQTEKLRLDIRMLEDKIAQITEKALQASEAKKTGRPFNYERALNQISAVIGLRGGDEFLHDEQESESN
jgi:hypothetical protein